jgi:protein-S-isoprenylcysteine O-methyltransferase Ste14
MLDANVSRGNIALRHEGAKPRRGRRRIQDMTEHTRDAPQAAPGRKFGVALGPVTLRGWWAALFLLALLALIAYEIIRDKPWVDPSPLWISGALWAWFEIYWGIKARGAATARVSESAKSRAVHTRLFMAAIVLFFVDVRGLNGHWVPSARLVSPLGVAIQSAGLWFAIWARKTLGRHWSGELTVKEGHEIVKSGPYRFIRHPIYTGILVMGLGTAVTSNSWHALIGFAVMSAAYWRKIRMEERWLVDAFGGAYVEYKRDSWALIPGIL